MFSRLKQWWRKRDHYKHYHDGQTTAKFDVVCPNCAFGTMEFEASKMKGIVPMYVHVCTECGHEESYTQIFPTKIIVEQECI